MNATVQRNPLVTCSPSDYCVLECSPQKCTQSVSSSWRCSSHPTSGTSPRLRRPAQEIPMIQFPRRTTVYLKRRIEVQTDSFRHIARLRNHLNQWSRVQQVLANYTVRGTSAISNSPRYSLTLRESQPVANIAE